MTEDTLTPRTARERALCRMAIKTLWDVNRTRAITDMFVIGAPSPTPEEIANNLFPEPAPRLREVTWASGNGGFVVSYAVTFKGGEYHLRASSCGARNDVICAGFPLLASKAMDLQMTTDTLRALLDLPNNPTLPP